MALVSSFMPKTTMVQLFPTNSKPCILQNKNVAIIRCAVKRPGINTGGPPQINQVLRVADRSLRTDQVVGLRRLNNGEDGKANAGNTVVDDVSNTTKTADGTD
ncbi:uncharacterized protein LOC133728269 [Rosa rugosa]|uniref:uncharacterized protein LOC133728269 n=1 Tax=Rosa rugosa TaxID=74645 RepID=UPI002B4027FD|nr:uncharacterized protein LOC133728269 [Rosa rugosa]